MNASALAASPSIFSAPALRLAPMPAAGPMPERPEARRIMSLARADIVAAEAILPAEPADR